MEIGFAALQDAGELLAIYSQYMETPITFECAPPTEEEFTERIRNISACYPYLVCRENGRIIGYAYAHPLAQRIAYQWRYKGGAWRGVAWFGKASGMDDEAPVPLRPLREVPREQVLRVLEAANA